MKWQDALLEFLFPTPTICVLCGTPLAAIGCCESCRTRMEEKRLRHGQCKRCGTFGVKSHVCDVCRHWPAYLAEVRSVWPYEDEVREAVAFFKYRNEPWRAATYAQLMAALLPAEADMLIPVPLHRKRFQERGYNQSLLLAKALAKKTGCPATDLLQRVRHTPHQVGLSRSARHRNLTDAFAVAHAQLLQGKTVVLIDDVMTTGATLEHSAKALHRAGVASVYGVVLASGIT